RKRQGGATNTVKRPQRHWQSITRSRSAEAQRLCSVLLDICIAEGNLSRGNRVESKLWCRGCVSTANRPRGCTMRECCRRTGRQRRKTNEIPAKLLTSRHCRVGACRRNRHCLGSGQLKGRVTARRSTACHATNESRRDQRPIEPGRA